MERDNERKDLSGIQREGQERQVARPGRAGPARAFADGIRIGTSGFSFADWIGPFYPPEIKKGQMLDFYCRYFDSLEINSTYYRLPHPAVLYQMERKTPDHFVFTAKLPGALTHERSRDKSVADAFLRTIRPLEDAGKYRGALAQFPWSFRRSPANEDYLRWLRDVQQGRPLFAEFRHSSWAQEEVLGMLAALGIGFCCVDEPQMRDLFPPLVRHTAGAAYLRFHGRNARTWWKGGGSERYDYLYREEELRPWAAEIKRLATKAPATYTFFNNCHAGRAAVNAHMMKDLLDL